MVTFLNKRTVHGDTDECPAPKDRRATTEAVPGVR